MVRCEAFKRKSPTDPEGPAGQVHVSLSHQSYIYVKSFETQASAIDHFPRQDIRPMRNRSDSTKMVRHPHVFLKPNFCTSQTRTNIQTIRIISCISLYPAAAPRTGNNRNPTRCGSAYFEDYLILSSLSLIDFICLVKSFICRFSSMISAISVFSTDFFLRLISCIDVTMIPMTKLRKI